MFYALNKHNLKYAYKTEEPCRSYSISSFINKVTLNVHSKTMWLKYEFMQFVGRVQGKRNKGCPVFDVLTTV